MSQELIEAIGDRSKSKQKAKVFYIQVTLFLKGSSSHQTYLLSQAVAKELKEFVYRDGFGFQSFLTVDIKGEKTGILHLDAQSVASMHFIDVDPEIVIKQIEAKEAYELAQQQRQNEEQNRIFRAAAMPGLR